MARQASSAPTVKLVVASITAFIMTTWGIPFLQQIGASPEDIEATTTLVESLLMGGAAFVVTLVAGYLTPPSPRDQVTG